MVFDQRIGLIKFCTSLSLLVSDSYNAHELKSSTVDQNSYKYFPRKCVICSSIWDDRNVQGLKKAKCIITHISLSPDLGR